MVQTDCGGYQIILYDDWAYVIKNGIKKKVRIQKDERISPIRQAIDAFENDSLINCYKLNKTVNSIYR